MRLTKKIVDQAKPSSKDAFIWDAELKGFALKVTPADRKVYLVQYRMSGRLAKTRRITLGTHGSLTCEQARRMAKKALGQVSSGIDPAKERDEAKRANSFQEIYEKFDQEHISVKLKASSARDYRFMFSKHVLPRFQNLPIRELSNQDVLRLHHALRDRPYRGNRVIAILSKFFNWCEEHGYRDEFTNPTRFVKKYKEKPRHRYLSTEEQERLGKALSDAEEQGIASTYAVNAIRLLSLTGARLREITNLKWEYVNFEHGTLDLPDSKTGRKTIYLSAAAKDIIAKIPRQADNPYVICGIVQGGPLINLQKPWSRIRKIADLEDVRMHDLRHTFASVAAMGGMSLPMIGALLGHSQPQTTARYAHLAANPLLEAVDKIGRKISATQ